VFKIAINWEKMAPIRSLLGNIGEVKWNPEKDQFGNRSININGINLTEGKDFQINPLDNKAYGDYSNLSNIIGSSALKPFNPNDLQKYQTKCLRFKN